MDDRFQLVLLNGFDRSGTSAIARTLATHPDVELLMQPFNSGPFRQKMYRIFTDDDADLRDLEFFAALTEGRIERDYIQSEWFFKHSTTQEIKPNSVHVLKTTINHFSAPWIVRRFPAIQMWGIWREPIEIMRSIFRNGFQTWYQDGHAAIQHAIRSHELLQQTLGDYLAGPCENETERVALNFAARTVYFFSAVQPRNVIRYDLFHRDANAAFGEFVQTFELSPFDFAASSAGDLNIIGQRRPSDVPVEPWDETATDKALAILDVARTFFAGRMSAAS